MSNQDQHQGEPGAADDVGQPRISPRGAARRRFAKAGLGASGVILTLASQPGMAADKLMCTSASAFGYLTPASHKHPAASACDGLSPGYWKNHTEMWVNEYSPQAKFGAVFTCYGFTADLAPVPLVEVLGPSKEWKDKFVDQHNVAMHIVAALLNAVSGRVPQLPKQKVFELWDIYARDQQYSPRPNVYWNGGKIVEYLTSTMG